MLDSSLTVTQTSHSWRQEWHLAMHWYHFAVCTWSRPILHNEGCRVRTDPGKSWNLIVTFSRPGKSWKVMEMRIAGVTNFSMIFLNDYQIVKNFGHVQHFVTSTVGDD